MVKEFIVTREYYSAIEKGNPTAYITRMDFEFIILSKISQTEKEKCCMILQNKIKQYKNSSHEVERKQVITNSWHYF